MVVVVDGEQVDEEAEEEDEEEDDEEEEEDEDEGDVKLADGAAVLLAEPTVADGGDDKDSISALPLCWLLDEAVTPAPFPGASRWREHLPQQYL